MQEVNISSGISLLIISAKLVNAISLPKDVNLILRKYVVLLVNER